LPIQVLVPPESTATASDKVFWFFSSEKNTFLTGSCPREPARRRCVQVDEEIIRGTDMKRLILSALLLGFILPLGGCVVEGPGRPGWCANHPYRCR
jgi:hypothetical protein